MVSSVDLAFALVPGIILFLYGIDHFSEETQRIAGEKFRSALGKLTKTRFGGAFLGAIVTSLIQSSTATTVIVVGLVGAGIIPFIQSVSIIIGANVGTTVTGQLIALKLTSFAPFFILLGFLLSIFGKSYKFLGKPIFYFGLVFFGLTLISQAIDPVKDDPAIVEIFSTLSNVFLAILAGIIFTIIMQSSSVTTGIVVLLVGSGLLDLSQGIPLIMGANIGTTLTSLVASMSLDLFAKRAAAAHLLFNVGGVLLFLPFLPSFADLVVDFGGSPAQQMANAHSLFNIIAAAVFLVAVNPFTRLVERLVPGDEKEIIFQTKYLNDKLPQSNRDAFDAIEKELRHSLEVTLEMYRHAIVVLENGEDRVYRKVEKLETFNDFLDDRISEALVQLSPRKMTEKEAEKTLLLVRMSNSVEQLGDLANSLAFLGETMENTSIHFNRRSIVNLDEVYKQFEKNMVIITENAPFIKEKHKQIFRKNDNKLRALVTAEYRDHLKMLSSKESYAGTSFVEAISIIEVSNSKIREIRKLSEEYSSL